MKKPVLTLLTITLCLSGALAFAAETKHATKLTQADAPLLDLGAEVGDANPAEKSHEAPKTNLHPSESPESPESHEPVIKKPVKKKTVSAKSNHAIHWGYKGSGRPEKWGDLARENISCKVGKNQSPIDLHDNAAVGTTGLPQLDIVYGDVPLKVLNNGHTIQINYPLGSYIKIGDRRYELLQFHFHTPSEHKKEGFNYPMEVHLVHKDGDGNLAVMGILFQEGEENELLNSLLSHLPTVVGKQQIHSNVSLNPAGFIPLNTEFYKYSGSLTTPPCSEGVYWMVFKQPIQASAEQIQKMNELMGDNSRPVQSSNSRAILKSWADQEQETLMYEYY